MRCHKTKQPLNASPAYCPQANRYAFSMLVWHERLVYPQEVAAEEASAKQHARASFGDGLRSMFGMSKVA